jgi:pimeloyl-ACP methyl ester carboxylesterase
VVRSRFLRSSAKSAASRPGHERFALSENIIVGRIFLTAFSACLILLGTASARAERASEIVAYDDVRIEVIAEGSGPLVVLLPSRGRAAEDFDVVAAGIARAGFRVLRPQPRGAGRSSGPMKDLSLHDFARDTAAVIRHESSGAAVLVGHAFGNWVARMTAVDHPQLVRGVAIVAAAAKAYPAGFDGAKALSEAVRKSGDPALSNAERLNYLRIAFFAPGSDAGVWLQGWYPEVDEAQFAAGRATKQSEWWPGGTVPLLDLQAALDPFKPRTMTNEIREEFGERATIVVIPNASHALLPEQPAAVVDAIVAWIRGLPR